MGAHPRHPVPGDGGTAQAAQHWPHPGEFGASGTMQGFSQVPEKTEPKSPLEER